MSLVNIVLQNRYRILSELASGGMALFMKRKISG
jgi:hypothetical protein